MADSVQIKEVNHWHQAIADMMLANPDMKKRDIAAQLGRTPAWLSAVIHSDAFVAYYEARRVQYNQELHQNTVVKLYNVAQKAIERVDEALDDKDLDPRYALDAKDRALEKLGFGSKNVPAHNSGTTNVQNNYYVSQESLAQARQRMLQVHEQKTLPPGGESAESGSSETPAELQHEEAPQNRG